MAAIGIIPARYGSTRFPGKPLIDLDGKSMIQRVYEGSLLADSLDEIWVATDDDRIFQHVEAFGGKAMMTSDQHQSGTSRCNEVHQKLCGNADVVVNIQGDELFMNPADINALVALFGNSRTDIATLASPINDDAELCNVNRVKVIFNHKMEAIYFSRSPLPYQRDAGDEAWCKLHTYYLHLGIYAYRGAILSELCQLEESALEKAESLEQLRWLENDYSIALRLTERRGMAIDAPSDVEQVLTYIRGLKLTEKR